MLLSSSCCIMHSATVLALVLMWCILPVHAQGEGVRFSLRGTTYQNNSLVNLEEIGEGDAALLCMTDNTACCGPPYTGRNTSVIGNWFFPNETKVLDESINSTSNLQLDFYRTRGQMVVSLHRRRGGMTGIYLCVIPNIMNVTQNLYVRVYTNNTGVNSPTNFTAEQVNSTSIQVSWTPPASKSNMTGYQIYYQTFGNWGTVDIDVNEIEYTITSLWASYTYNISLVAVFPNATVGHKIIMPGEGVRFSLRGTTYQNNSLVNLEDIGEDDNRLLCLTDQPACCRPPYTSNAIGNWFLPDGTRVASSGQQRGFHRTRGPSVVYMHRRRGGEDGIYRCEIPDTAGVIQNLYIGVYNASTGLGDVVVSSMQFQLTSALNATPTFTLTCTSTGGPATTVSWTVNNHTLPEDSAHHITSQITNTTTATYNHTLTVTGRLVGEYECSVSNNKPSSSSGLLAVVAADHTTGLTAERLPQEPRSFRVSWTPPASLANLTGYRIYYSGAGDSGSVDVGTSTTNITLDNRTTSVTYTITMVALSSHLPSPVVGPVTITLPDVRFSLNGTVYQNNSLVNLEDIGEGDAALHCLTDLTTCCRTPYTSNAIGNWYFPNGTRAPSSGAQWDIHRTRGHMMVLLHRRRGGVEGVYSCVIPDTMNVTQTIYIGVYTADTGDVVVSSMQFQLISELNATTPTFTLTCTSTGGPATTVSWTVNNHTVTEDGDHHIASQVMTDAETATYIHTLKVTGRLVGVYECNVSNNKPSSSSGIIALPLPNVQFTPSTFAMTGEPYSLTCTVQVVQYLAAISNVTWLTSDGSPLQNGSGITVEKAVRNGNITTLRFTVDPLDQSHIGNYTCRACISIGEAVIEGDCEYAMAEVTLSVPGSVQKLEILHISDQSVSVLWGEPETTNGAIVNYTVQVQRYQPVSRSSRELELVTINPEFNRNISTATLTLSSDGRFMINISDGLEPLVPYRVTVVAVNLAGPGEQETKDFFTREGAPSTAPGNVEVIRLNGTAMNVSWVPLNLVEARGFVQNYIITYQQASSGSRRRRQEQTQQVDGSASYAIVGGLQPGVTYEVTVSGMTTQTGPVSSPTLVQPKPEMSAIIAGVVAALVVALIVIIIVVVIAYFLYNSRHKGEASNKTKEMYLITEMYELTENGTPLESSFIKPRASSIRSKKDEPVDEQETDSDVEMLTPIPVPSVEVTDRMKPISIISFRDHVQQMHSEGDRSFESEYQSLGSEPTASHDAAKLASNGVKNRFTNIFPYDFSRVKLNKIKGEEGSDYINASFLDGYNRESAYIASQGPMSNTVSDFWRMIWENWLPNIVMLTKCMEAGRRKCEQYWGDNIGDDFETPDHKLKITTTYVLPHADFDIRNLTVKSIENPDAEPLRVTQYHFTSWPDHGVPQFATSLIAFIRRVQKGHNKNDGYPLLVHCSAGVGRTGTFILLDSMLERMKKEDTVNVYEFLFNMRAKRTMMVQSQAQYIFIHDALEELITCGETDIKAAGLRVKVNRLRKTIPGKGITGFAEQFQLLDQVSRQPEEGDFSDGQEYYNRGKNRYPDKLPYNTCRTHLRPTGEDGSEYINASFVDGYKRRNAYIATQAPLQTTVDDFWRMIWEFRSRSIVMLCNIVEDNQETSYPYWPTKEDETIKYGKILVTMQSKTAYGDYSVRMFKLQEDEVQVFPTEGFQVTQFHYTEWPETGKPPSSGGLIEMIDLLMKTQMKTGDRAITVMCNDAVGRTGTFICIHSQLERLKTEGVVDIFQSVKSARIQRAGLVPEADQYAFCHEVLADYVDEISNYANFKDMN